MQSQVLQTIFQVCIMLRELDIIDPWFLDLYSCNVVNVLDMITKLNSMSPPPPGSGPPDGLDLQGPRSPEEQYDRQSTRSSLFCMKHKLTTNRKRKIYAYLGFIIKTGTILFIRNSLESFCPMIVEISRLIRNLEVQKVPIII